MKPLTGRATATPVPRFGEALDGQSHAARFCPSMTSTSQRPQAGEGYALRALCALCSDWRGTGCGGRFSGRYSPLVRSGRLSAPCLAGRCAPFASPARQPRYAGTLEPLRWSPALSLVLATRHAASRHRLESSFDDPTDRPTSTLHTPENRHARSNPQKPRDRLTTAHTTQKSPSLTPNEPQNPGAQE